MDNLEFRYPKKEDLEQIRQYINTISKEKTFIRFQGEGVSFEEEEKYLNGQIERIAKKLSVQLLVFSDGKLIGISGIDLRDRVEKHIGLFGITIAKEFRGRGLGSKLMQAVIDKAIKSLPDLEIIILAVYAENDLARKMYENFGFREYGMLPKGLKRESGYSDHVFMYKTVREHK